MTEVLLPVPYTLQLPLLKKKDSSWLRLPLVLLSFACSIASTASADVLPWATNSGLTNEVVYTLSIDCVDPGLVCAALNGYSDVQVATVIGLGDIDMDLVGGTLQFLQDGTQDVGAGPQASYTTVNASDLTFAAIPFVGAPETEDGVVFALTNPIFSAGGPLLIGSYPVSANVDYSAIADIVGVVDAYVPDIVVTPQTVAVNGTLKIIAIGGGGGVFYRLEDLTATMNVAHPTTLLDEDVTVNVTADMTLNLEGNTISPGGGTSVLPALGGWGVLLLAGGLALLGRRLTGARLARGRNRS
jgi:hypothetical protein